MDMFERSRVRPGRGAGAGTGAGTGTRTGTASTGAHHPDAGVLAGLRQGVLIAAAALVLVLPPMGRTVQPTAAAPPRPSAAQATAPAPRVADFGVIAPGPDARLMADWVIGSRDNQRLPFVILDKRDARVFVFDATGRLIAASPVLLGAAPGDDSVAGIGVRPIELVRPEERTTAAGRFISEPGKNAAGEDVVWVDYAAAVSMHRVRVVDPKERRLARLASVDPAERRISYGCINVPVAFFEAVVWPTLGSGRGVIYVLPEIRDLRRVFASAVAWHERTAQTLKASTPSTRSAPS
jgi:hypothetical protein